MHSDGTVSSGVAYYSNLNPGGNVNQQPDDYVDVVHGTNYVWEQTGSGEQNPLNDLICLHFVFGGSQGLEVHASAGTADNGFQNFWVYKDTGTFLYSVDGWRCDSIYFAF
jgi:hypothetical protein